MFEDDELLQSVTVTLPADFLEILKREFPRRKGGNGWGDVVRLVQNLVRNGHKWADILSGTRSYKQFCDREGMTGTEYVRMSRTFFGPGAWWQEDYSEPAKPRLPSEIAAERRWQALQERADKVGFRNPIPLEKKVDPSVYEGQLQQAEQQSNVRAIR